ncbi:MAG: S-methyl-5'-thioinosine phosphorylase [Actinobacteria bacterium]|nr:S-methyl-5'-thioinosine phosphorylase [Actinomycetota bacterium]
MTCRIALLAGTGFYDLPALAGKSPQRIETRYGSAEITIGQWQGAELVFLTRHGGGHSIPPHKINYRANIQALKDQGVSAIIAINVVGCIDTTLAPGDLTLIEDFVDFTSGRTSTFFDGEDGVRHIDMTNVYSKTVRTALSNGAKKLGIPLREGGIYAGFNGPRFETPAEIRFAALAGVTVVGMTGCPEAALAREIGVPYAAIALIVNPAAGLFDGEISEDDIKDVLVQGKAKTLSVIEAALPELVSIYA